MSKMRLFMSEMHPHSDTTVIDVGVSNCGPTGGAYGTENFFEALYPWPGKITAVAPTSLDSFKREFPRVRAIRADGRSLPFEANEFDIGFCNAVVEHFPDQASQHALVAEICRVSRRVFLTTPNKWFPIDPHTLLPFAHWLPTNVRETTLRCLRQQEGLGVRLLRPVELVGLFPGTASVHVLRTVMSLVVAAETTNVG